MQDNKPVTYLLVAGLIGVLVLIRYNEATLFYDPITRFFDNVHYEQALPAYDGMKLFGSTLFRYLMNSIVSIAIIYLLFKKESFVKLSLGIYLIAFLILTALYFYLLDSYHLNDGFLLLFYTRRFLIQPLLLLVLLPAFYYQKRIIEQ